MSLRTTTLDATPYKLPGSRRSCRDAQPIRLRAPGAGWEELVSPVARVSWKRTFAAFDFRDRRRMCRGSRCRRGGDRRCVALGARRACGAAAPASLHAAPRRPPERPRRTMVLSPRQQADFDAVIGALARGSTAAFGRLVRARSAQDRRLGLDGQFGVTGIRCPARASCLSDRAAGDRFVAFNPSAPPSCDGLPDVTKMWQGPDAWCDAAAVLVPKARAVHPPSVRHRLRYLDYVRGSRTPLRRLREVEVVAADGQAVGRCHQRSGHVQSYCVAAPRSRMCG